MMRLQGTGNSRTTSGGQASCPPVFFRKAIVGTLSAVACCALGLVALGAAPDEGVAQGASAPVDLVAEFKFFESRVRPVLSQQCLHCHGPKRQRGELRLDSLAAMLKGGESGPAIVPGQPEESLIVGAIRHESFQMPPESKLTDDEIAAIVEWIRRGAHWPETERTIAAGPRTRKELSAEDRSYWAFQPLGATSSRMAVAPIAGSPIAGSPMAGSPMAGAASLPVTPRTPVDGFILARLHDARIAPSPEADRRSLLRRLWFDLVGLPPDAETLDEFLVDEAPDAYERQVDRLLADPRHGQRWAQHWLDLVRYAESDGFKQDDYRPTAWRYRDYVIGAFNSDKPYDRFVQEQLAGDELAPQDPEALIATGYLRHWMYEYNQRDVRSQWNNILNDITDVTSDVFLAMGLGCARCHDHKYDPLLQKDYYRFQAFFAALQPRDDVPVASPGEFADYQSRLADWEAKTAELRAETAALEAAVREQITRAAIDKFPKDVRPMLRKPLDERDPFERQLADLAFRQVVLEQKNVKMESKLKDAAKEKWQALQKRLLEYDIDRPPSLPTAMSATDVGPVAPATYVPGARGTPPIPPGFLSVLDPADAEILPPESGAPTTGRRLTLARWLTRPDHPLTTRVMANRVWQYHFGRGLVRTASDFGRLGEPPTHPELLDWLSQTLIQHDWQLKPLHRLLVTSATYRQSALTPATPTAKLTDPDNRLWWRMDIRRLSAEQMRDALLAATGELDGRVAGPGVEWKEPRRTVYTKVLRNTRDPLLEAFDSPDHIISSPERNVTTTPTQALLMVNGAYTQDRARQLTARLKQCDATAPEQRVRQAYRWALGRVPTNEEERESLDFLGSAAPLAETAHEAAWVDLCHVLLNSNEFLYVD